MDTQMSDYERGVRAGQIEGVTFAARNIRGMTHHCHWLNIVGYRRDPLDQGLVNHVLEGASNSLKWWTNNPNKLAEAIKGREDRAAERAALQNSHDVTFDQCVNPLGTPFAKSKPGQAPAASPASEQEATAADFRAGFWPTG